MAKEKTVVVVYDGSEPHVHVEDRAFDRGRPVELPRTEAGRLTGKLKDLHVVKDKD
jgi:hypothetical protein